MCENGVSQTECDYDFSHRENGVSNFLSKWQKKYTPISLMNKNERPTSLATNGAQK